MSAPWVSGGRVSPRVLERLLTQALLAGARDVGATRVARRCERIWRHAVETLGPVSGAHAVWEHLVAPCAAALDWPVGSAESRQLSELSVRVGVTTAGLEEALLVALPWGVDPRALQRPLVRLGADARRPWVATCNGRTWCWHDVRRPYAREHLAFDLAHASSDGRLWQALWLLGHRWPPRLDGKAGVPWLERLVADSQVEDATAVTALRGAVDAAMTTLSRAPSGTRDDQVRQVFQWMFLLCAESRSLLPSWHAPYRRSYTVSALAREAASGTATGVREAVSAIAQLGREGGRIGGVAVAALNGRLFEPTPVTRRRSRVTDDVVASALGALTGTGRGALTSPPIDYAQLRVEHLGGVYEHLMAPPTAVGGPPLDRKRSGAFYTPRSLADLLVHRALAPVVDDVSAEEILGLRILDPAMGSGALLSSALRYLVNAVEAAWVREGRGGPLDVSREERSGLPRRIAEQCLFGVDLDATAVQVARMSIWLLSLAPDRPLTWLDAHLRVGNSLVGTSPDVVLSRPPLQRRAPSRQDGQLTLFELSQWHHEAGEVGSLLAALSARPTDSPADAHAKSDTLARLRSRDPIAAWRRRADAWCGAAMDPVAVTAAQWHVVDAAVRDQTTEAPRHSREMMARWLATAAAEGCLHWPLEFPDVFDAGRGGFDVVIANPPWEMLRGDLGSDGDRAERRGDIAPLLRFVRRSGTYRRVSGHVNSYQLFVERMLQLVRPGGRLGCLLPGAVLGDHGASGLRRHLLDQMSIDHLSIIDNRAGLFPIHRSMRIVAATGTTGAPTDAFVVDGGIESSRARTRAHRGGDAQARADQHPPAAHGRLITRALLRDLGPSESIPDVRHDRDLRILVALASAPALGGPAWQLRFGRELNATEDAATLRRRPGTERLPVVDGKHLSAFAVHPPPDGRWIAVGDAERRLAHEPWRRWRLAYRDVSSPTNARSLIAALLPPDCVSTHTIFCLRSPLALRRQLYLCGMLNSLVTDWFVRRFLGAHVTTRLMASVRVPFVGSSHRDGRAVTRLTLRLMRNPDDEHAQARLHRIAAELHGLSIDDLAHIAEDFPRLSPAVWAAMLTTTPDWQEDEVRISASPAKP